MTDKNFLTYNSQFLKWNSKYLTEDQPVIPPTPSYPIDGLLLEWMFESSTNDTSGQGNHGFTAALDFSTGKVGTYALNFPGGANNYVYFPVNFFETNMASDKEWTYSMWIKFPVISYAGFMGPSGSASGLWALMWTTYRWWLTIGSATLDAPDNCIIPNEWTFLTFGKNSTQGWIKTWNADTSTYNASWNSTGVTPPARGILGVASGAGGGNFTVDALRFYNRTLSHSEILQLWNNGIGI